MVNWIKDTFRYYTTIIELSRCSNRELEDLGLSRYEIVQIAFRQSFLK